MLSVQQAIEHIRNFARPLPTARVPLSDALGLHLAEPVVSGIDSPPFDKSMVDGYALRADDPSETRRVVEQVTAGQVAQRSVEPGTTVELMTGAPMPAGADAVVKWEDIDRNEDGTIGLAKVSVRPDQCVTHRGASFRQGDVVLQQGDRLQAVGIGLLAEIGQPTVAVTPRPRVAVLPTGNELVECDQPLAPGQIRNSNGPMLIAALESLGIQAENLGVGRDDPEDLRRRIGQGLACDVLLISGGVSAGVMDLVPGVLQELGIRQVFHKVRMKPGKPIWFGVREQDARQTLVFGLPGNPVSTLVAFEVFVKPVLKALAGEGFQTASPLRGVLTSPIEHRGNRPSYQPCRILFGQRREGLPCVEPFPWRGSANLAALAKANALAVLPEGDYVLAEGSQVEVFKIS